MDSKAASLLFLASMCLFCSTSMAFNITKILSNFPEFSNFNDFLSQTGVAQQINSRRTITVLAVDNGNLDALSGRPVDVVKRILDSHVILDYFDQQKLANLKKKSSILTTLYQASGIADSQQGFLNVTTTPDGIMFGSAVQDAPLTASLVKAVAAQPYNISVLQVSDIIEVPGIDIAGAPKKAPAPPPPPPAKAPAKPPAKPPAPSKDDEPATPPSEEEFPAESPVEGPATADGPIADSPLGSPSEADKPVADTPNSSGAVSRTFHMGGLSAALVLAAAVLAF